MPQDLILGTAGHIDHGKTALVKALTGIDCDRLPEEKARGITIDIGFASLELGEVRIGIVDVPGHERFIKNMLAGATGIDLAMLVVAADDSIMPQTREHLEILRLLGLQHGLIALTKCDLVDATTREVVELEVRELARGTFLEKAPLVRTSAQSGAGIVELKAALAETCRHVEVRTGQEWFRMAIDRSFVVQGHGTVVTGSVTSGSVHIGDELEWQPRGQLVRVRSLQNHDRSVDEAHRGQRAAINLAGIHHQDVVRGQELATPGYLVPVRVLTVRLHCLNDVKRPIKHRLPVRFHLGTAEIIGTLALLEGDVIEPGNGVWRKCSWRNRSRPPGASPLSSADRRPCRHWAAARCCSPSRTRFAGSTWRCWNVSSACGAAPRSSGRWPWPGLAAWTASRQPIWSAVPISLQTRPSH